jgi:hypothetical protein
MFLLCSFGRGYDVRVILIKFQTIHIFLIVICQFITLIMRLSELFTHLKIQLIYQRFITAETKQLSKLTSMKNNQKFKFQIYPKFL